jgi:hypothetical protein
VGGGVGREIEEVERVGPGPERGRKKEKEERKKEEKKKKKRQNNKGGGA